MRRTGSEEIGSSKALGRAGMIPGLPRLLLLVIFLVELQSGGLGSQNTTMPGALCPASSSLLCFIGWSYPQIVLYSRFLFFSACPLSESRHCSQRQRKGRAEQRSNRGPPHYENRVAS